MSNSPRSRVPYDEWEVLYRQRLQVERDLRARTMADVAVLGASEVGTSTVGEEAVAGAIDIAGDVMRAGITAVAAAADDEETAKALDRAAGREWRWAARVATIAVALARAVIGFPGRPAGGGPDRRVGEPIAAPSDATGIGKVTSPDGG